MNNGKYCFSWANIFGAMIAEIACVWQQMKGLKFAGSNYRKLVLPILSFYLLFMLTGCSVSNVSYDANHKFSPAELQEDSKVLWQTLQEVHPSLYWYNSKDSVDAAFNNLPAMLTDSLTEAQFRNVLAQKVALVRCGHTSIRSSKAASKSREGIKKPFFPLQVKTWAGDSMIVLANAFRQDSVLTRGTSIHRINDLPVRTIVDSICRFISADGLHNNFRYQLISNNFPGWYRAIFGIAENYKLDITATNGDNKTVYIKNFDPIIEDSIAGKKPGGNEVMHRIPERHYRYENDRKLTIDTARHLAIMDLNTFSHAKLPSFFRKSFRKLKKENIENLVIELRENGGGNIINSTRLSRYLSDHPFKVADTVAAKSFKYPYPSQVKNGFIYKLQSWFVTSRRDDGRLHYRMYEKKYFKPYTKNHFDGKVFLLTGGFTFSASTLFINPLVHQENITIIGEETGGGAYGNTAVNVPDLTLPNTGIRVRLPLYHLVVNKNLPHNGRGIIPDILVPPSSWHLARRIDPKMMKVYELIGSK